MEDNKKNWEKLPLSSVIKLVGGGTPKTDIGEYWGGDIPWISVKDFNNDFRYIYSTEKTITPEGLNNSSTKLLEKDDIIISARGTVGEIGMIFHPMAFNQSCYGIKPIEELSDSKFIYYSLKNIVDMIKTNVHGSVFDTITKSTFDNIILKIPPLKEQVLIGNILSIFDDKIELSNKINKNLEKQVHEIYKEWFINFNFIDDTGNKYNEVNGEMKSSPIGMIPSDWNVESLGNGRLSKIIGSGIDKFEGCKYYVATADVANNEMNNELSKISMNNKPSRANMQPVAKSVWFAKMKDSRKLIFVDEYSKDLINQCIFSTGFAGLKCSENSFYYIWSFILSSSFDTMKNNLALGTTMQAINNTNIKKIGIVSPTENVLHRFNKLVKPIFEKIYLNNLENKSLTLLRDLLLPKLMSGEIDVSGVEV